MLVDPPCLLADVGGIQQVRHLCLWDRRSEKRLDFACQSKSLGSRGNLGFRTCEESISVHRGVEQTWHSRWNLARLDLLPKFLVPDRDSVDATYGIKSFVVEQKVPGGHDACLIPPHTVLGIDGMGEISATLVSNSPKKVAQVRQQRPIRERRLALKINDERIHSLLHVEIQNTGNLPVRRTWNETCQRRPPERWK